MYARDSVQAAIAADRHRVVDGAGHAGVALCRPGVRRLGDESAYDAGRAAYLEMVARGEAAWRGGLVAACKMRPLWAPNTAASRVMRAQ
jgi:hypothetical protein